MNFSQTGLRAELCLKLRERDIVEPTPIQAQAIPVILGGDDLIGIAQTGTGKTFAFGLPLIEILSENEGTALILAPTRELAMQIEAALVPYAKAYGQRLALLVGGAPMFGQEKALRGEPRIVVATPGRLLDHAGKGTVRLRRFTHVVLDEADRMLDMGFLPAIQEVFERLGENRQTLMFSATFAPEIASLAQNFLRNPKRVDVAPPGTPVEQIDQAVYIVDQEQKNDFLNQVVREVPGPVLVFARTRHGARKVAKALRSYGHSAVEIHADRTQAQRDQAMAGFRSGANRILVATDIAARGIDVKDIELVVQFDLPDVSEDYTHRIGRTGRAGSDGRAVIFVTPEHVKKLEKMEDQIGYVIATDEGSPLPRPDRKYKHRPRANRTKLEQNLEAAMPVPTAPEPERTPRPERIVARNRDEAPRSESRENPRFQDRREAPRFEQPRDFRRPEAPQYQDRRDAPRFENRGQGGGFQRNDRPRFDNRSQGGFQRDERPRFENRGEGGSFQRDERPRFDNRGQGGFQRDERPRFDDRARFDDRNQGGFQREERPRYENRGGFQRDDRPRFDNRGQGGGFQRDDRPSFDNRGQGGGYRGDNPRFRGPQSDRFQDRRDAPRFDDNRGRGPEGEPRFRGPQSEGFQDRRDGADRPERRQSTGMSRKTWEPKAKGPLAKKRPRPGLKAEPVAAPATGRPKPSGTPKAYKVKTKKKGVPSNGFQPPKRKRR